MIEKQTCLVCKPGHVFVNGKCKESGEDKNDFKCVGSPCLFCVPGYYMDDSGACVEGSLTSLAEM